jgi:hypothetical protein
MGRVGRTSPDVVRRAINRRAPLMRALVCSVILAALLVGPAQSPAGADPQGAKILFGAFPGPRGNQSPQQAVQALEAQIGRPLAGVRVFDLWDSPFPDPYTTWLRDSGHTVFLSVRPKRVNGSVILWRDIANAQPGSTLYNQIVGWANNVKAFGAPMYFIFNHEPEAAASNSMGTAQEFIAAWRNVITIFRDQGVTNAKYVWTMTDYAFWRTDGGRADLWYPGDAYVDAIASDSYNWYNCRPGINTAWHTLEWIASYMRTFGLAHPDEQLMLMEWASHDPTATPGRKATWINEAEALFKQPGWEQFTTVLYYHNTLKASCTFWADSSASSLAAFATMANDPFYGRTEAGGGSPDTSPPTAPGRPAGQSNAPGAITLSWPASSDDVATTLSYSIYRDGGTVPVGTVSSASTTTVSFTDSGLVGGSIHSYVVTASDGQNTSQASPPSDPITVQQATTAIFQDGFDSGFGNWTTVSGLTLDQGAGQPAPSARAQTNASRAWASEVLPGTYPMACVSAQVNLTSTVDGGSLLRFRTTADGALIRVAISSGRVLQLRNDVSGSLVSTGVVLPTGVWTGLELCGTAGTGGSWTLYENGVQIFGPWAANTGTAVIGRVTIGTPDARTMTVNFDNVVVDQQAG